MVAYHLGQEIKQAGPIVRWLRRSIQLAQQYGYAGLALALCVPFFPDTISIYAFAVLERDYPKFAAATFIGSLGRLIVTLGVFGGLVTIF